MAIFKKHWLVVIVIFAFGSLVGWLLKDFWSGANSRGIIIRENGYRLISPILACEIGSKDDFAELKPIESDIGNLVKTKLAAGEAKDISVYLRLANSGRWIGVQEDKQFAPASLFKVLVMMAYLKASESDPKLLSKSLIYKASDEFNGRPPTLEFGKAYTVENLIQKMITDSDNSALYLLVDNAPINSVNEVFQDLNLALPETQSEEALDVMSPKAYSLVFRVLYGASYLNKSMSEKALTLLSQTQFKDGLVANLPANLLVAHKFGIKKNELHDCGIIYYPGHPYILCVMTRGEDLNQLAKSIADISLLAYQELDKFFKSGH